MIVTLLCVWLLVMNASCQVYKREYHDYSLLVPDNNQGPIEQVPIVVDPEMKRVKRGSNITLDCKSHGCQWEFTPCKPCIKNDAPKWTKVDTKKKCMSRLHLHDVSTVNNGFYKCIVKNAEIITYQVDVVEPTNYDGHPPKLFDINISPNSTIRQSENVVIRCKVLSEYEPAITWFKQTENHIKYDIEYDKKHYNRINMTHQVYRLPNENNVYISKFSLQNATLSNSGIYVCVALTETGKDLKSFTIRVIPDANFSEQPRSLSVLFLFALFLFPLLFILGPISVWLCYFRNKTTAKADNQSRREEVLLTTYQM